MRPPRELETDPSSGNRDACIIGTEPPYVEFLVKTGNNRTDSDRVPTLVEPSFPFYFRDLPDEYIGDSFRETAPRFHIGRTVGRDRDYRDPYRDAFAGSPTDSGVGTPYGLHESDAANWLGLDYVPRYQWGFPAGETVSQNVFNPTI